MKILFVSTMCSDLIIEKIISGSLRNQPSIAGIRFDRNFAKGLSKYVGARNIQAYSLKPVPPYPLFNSLFLKSHKEDIEDISTVYCSLLNLSIIKQLWIVVTFLIAMLRWCVTNWNEGHKAIIISSIALPFSLPAKIVSGLFGVRVIAVVTDLPDQILGYRSDINSAKNALNVFVEYLNARLSKSFDGYILLSEYMGEMLKPETPFVVIEGMIEEELCDSIINGVKKENAVMYAGGLNVKYGIETLVNAFLSINIKDIELWIFGSGDYEISIKEFAEKNHRIMFFGLVPQNQVFLYEQRSRLLVNPRPASEAYTKYSFPSKTIEYMLSGTPLLTTKLPGIPEEYFNYCYTIDDESRKGLAKAIEQVLSLPQSEIEKMERRAREFIINNKTSKIQGKRIFDFCKSVITNNRS